MTVPSGFSSVMAMRVPTNPDDLEFFPTPPWAARAGGELIRQLDPEAVNCWEPACGAGHMAHALRDYFPKVWASDIHDYGYGWTTEHGNFLGDDPRPFDFAEMGDLQIDWVITNPPFKDGAAFVRQGLKYANRGVAMLLRLVFLEGQERYKLLYGDTPVTVVAPFAERVPMVKGHWDPKASSATAYAWFIWLKPAANPFPEGVPVIRPIAPGAKARLTKPDDAVLFGWVKPETESTLFDNTEGLPFCSPYEGGS